MIRNYDSFVPIYKQADTLCTSTAILFTGRSVDTPTSIDAEAGT